MSLKFRVDVTPELLMDLGLATADNALMMDNDEDRRQLEGDILAVLWRHRPQPGVEWPTSAEFSILAVARKDALEDLLRQAYRSGVIIRAAHRSGVMEPSGENGSFENDRVAAILRYRADTVAEVLGVDAVRARAKGGI